MDLNNQEKIYQEFRDYKRMRNRDIDISIERESDSNRINYESKYENKAYKHYRHINNSNEVKLFI